MPGVASVTFDPIPQLSRDLIVIDPPWDFETYSEAGEEKGPRAQYTTMGADAIRELPVGHLARGDCLLLCWATWPTFPLALECVKAWGFAYKSVIVWSKVFPSGKPAMGTGYRVRSLCEPIIVATIGAPIHRPFMGLFAGIRREHSRKPSEFYAMVDDCCPDLTFRADIFARESRPGWSSWGNEADKFDAPALQAAE
jgi:N6-adenosine-specific RNA methylase IME4